MKALLIITAFFVLLALLRFRVFAEYGAEGVQLTARLGPVLIWLYPKPPKKMAKEAAKKSKKSEKKQKAAEEGKKPGRLREFYELLPVIKETLGKLRRRLLIKNLTLHYTASGGNAAVTALSFGAANAAVGMIVPVLENSFRIKKRDIRMNADFEAGEPFIYIGAAVSIAVWEAVYILFYAAVMYVKRSKNNGKEKSEYGKASNR